MRRDPEQIDEYILAAYLSGELPARLRKEIAAYLADNTRARELLGMASEALEVIESGDGAPPQLALSSDMGDGKRGSTGSSSPSVQIPVDRRANNNRYFWRIAGLISAAVLALAITLVIHLVIELRTDSPNTEFVSDGWEPVVEIDQLKVSWPSVPGAASYQVVLYDPVEESLVSRSKTTSTSFKGFLDDLEYMRATAGANMQIWIEAFDTNGDYLQASRRVNVSISNQGAVR